MMTERELVERCKNGEEKALRLLYEKYAPLMMGISMRYTGNEESSKDMLHDSFVKILVSFQRFEYRGVGSLKAWISKIVVNVAISGIKNDKEFFDSDKIDVIAETDDRNDDLELYEAVTEDVIIKCVGQLPVRLSVVFNLFMFENMPHNEIARKLKISESASRVRLHRAKEMLAKALKESINKTKDERR